MISRREFFSNLAALGSGAFFTKSVGAFAAEDSANHHPDALQSSNEAGFTPVMTPNGTTLPWKMVDGVKVFHLVAQECEHEFAPGLTAKCWGYNGSTPGPTIEAVEGDRVRIYVTNHLSEPTSLHWHGILVPNGMDGVSGLTQRAIPSGETFKYEFVLKQHGTFMYHSHFDDMTQSALGMMGMFVIHPKRPRVKIDRDFAIMLSEWKIAAGASRPDPTEMTDFNVLTMNSKAFPGTAPLLVQKGNRVRIRFGNLGAMEHHPIHLHGYVFKITATDGGDIPEAAQWPATTVLVPVGSTRTIEFVADAEGDWAMHCHMTHHTMNQMGHGLPNMIGVDSGKLDAKLSKLLPDYMPMNGEMSGMEMPTPRNSIPMRSANGPFGKIDMGGMFTILKVRSQLANGEQDSADGGWYSHPAGTVAQPASAEEMQRDLGK